MIVRVSGEKSPVNPYGMAVIEVVVPNPFAAVLEDDVDKLVVDKPSERVFVIVAVVEVFF